MEKQNELRWHDNETEIDLVQLLVEELKHIKVLLLCAALCALVLGGWKALSSAGTTSDAAQNAQSAAQPTASTATAQEQLEANRLQAKNTEEQLAKVKEKIEAVREYGEDSILLNLKPESFHRRDAVWYIDTHYQINTSVTVQNPNPIASVLGACRAVMNGPELIEYVRARMTDKLDARYISELICVDTDASSTLLSLTVLGSTEQMADELYAAALEYFATRKPSIEAAIGSFDATLVDELAYDSGLAAGEGSLAYMEKVTEARDSYDAQMTNLQNQESSLAKTLATLRQAMRDLEKTLGDAQAAESQTAAQPTGDVTDTPNKVKGLDKKTVVKYALIGFFAGLLAASIWIAVRFVSKDAALNEEELRKRYGVYVLASVRRFSGTGAWRRMLSGLCGDKKRSDTPEEAVGLAEVNMTSVLESNGEKDGKVLLVGNDAAALAETERLFRAIRPDCATAGGNIVTDRKALEVMREYQNIVVVERKENISYREIGRELEKLSLLNKNVVGLIAL